MMVSLVTYGYYSEICRDMSVQVQWNNKLTDKIPLEQGIGKDQRYHL
jgi:hypothetical protein